MNIFFINFVVMIAEAFIFLYGPKSDPNMTEEMLLKRKKIFVFLVCIQWILISGLRADSVGADTINYMKTWEDHRTGSWSRIFKYFVNYYKNGSEEFTYEPGFVILEKLISCISKDRQFYKFVIAIIFMGSLGRFVYINSEDPFLAFLLYDGIFYNMFSLTGYRQVVSVAVGILWSYEFLKKRKFIPFLICILIGYTMHKTTLFFLPFYFISQKKQSATYVLTAIIIIIIMIITRNRIFLYIKGMVGYEQYGVESNFTQRNFLVLFTCMVIVCIWRYKYVISKYPQAKVYYNGLIMSGAMIPFAMVSPTSMRLVYDFAFQMMFLLPLVYQSFEKKDDRIIAYSLTVFIFGFFILTKTPPYVFHW